MQAAHAAYPAWRALPVAERAALLRKAGDLMQQRVYDIAAALTLEVGKNRMEALGEAQETRRFLPPLRGRLRNARRASTSRCRTTRSKAWSRTIAA